MLEQRNRKRLWVSLLLGVFFLLGLGILFAFLIARAALSSVVKSRLADVVIASSDSIYTLQIDSLLISADEIRATDIKLVPYKKQDTKSLEANYELSLQEISISKPKWTQLLQRNLEVERIEIKRPNIVFEEVSMKKDEQKKKESPTSIALEKKNPTFSERALERYIDKFHIKEVRIEDASLNYFQSNQGSSLKRPDSLIVSLFAENILLEFSSKSKERLEYRFDEFRFEAKPFRRRLPNSLYEVSFESIKLSVKDSTFSINHFSFAPAMSDIDFAKEHRYRPTLVKVKFDSLNLFAIDYKRMLFAGEFIARSAALHKLDVYAMTNKRIPNPPRIPNSTLPHEAFAKINTRFHIDSMSIFQSRVVYACLQPQSREGAIRFEDLNGHVQNLSNFPDRMTAQSPLKISASTRLMGEALLKADLSMPLLSKTFELTFKATLSGLNVKSLNHFLIPEARIQLESGLVEKVIVTSDVKNGVGTGRVSPIYQNLRMLVLTEDRSKKRGFMEGLKTFMANRFGVKSDNPNEGKPLREATVRYVRKRDESIFEYIWQFIWSGLKKVMT